MLKTKEITKPRVKNLVNKRKINSANSDFLLGLLGLGFIALTTNINSKTNSNSLFEIIKEPEVVPESDPITYSIEVLINGLPTKIQYNEDQILILPNDLAFVDIDSFLDHGDKLQEYFGINDREQLIELYNFIEHYDPFIAIDGVDYTFQSVRDLKITKFYRSSKFSYLINNQVVDIIINDSGFNSIKINNTIFTRIEEIEAEEIAKYLFINKITDKHCSYLGQYISNQLKAERLRIISYIEDN